jgi:lambda repressor-like predicted transcriptional regulator
MRQIIDKHKTEKTTNFDFIRGLLAMRRIKSREIVKATGVSDSYVCKILTGVRKNRTVQQYIADALGMSFDELWNTKP